MYPTGSVTTINIYLACSLQHVHDMGLKISVMNPSFPELPCIAIVLPVMVPIAPTVCSETKHIHL